VQGYFSDTGTVRWSYSYDADGLRTAKTSPTGQITTYDWDKSSSIPLLVAESTGTAVTRYVYGPGGQPFQQINPDGSATYLHHDQLGSVRLLTNSTGNQTGAATYKPYGELDATTGTLSKVGYAGQYTDAETGLQYLRARYYEPSSGQFLSRDPAVVLTGEPYGYTGGNPLNYTDPTGLFWGDITRLVGKGLVIVAGVTLGAACGVTIVCGAIVGGGIAFGLYAVDHIGIGSDKWDTGDAIKETVIGAVVGGATAGVAAAVGGAGGGAAANTGDDAARFVVDAAGNTTLRVKGSYGWLDVSQHAAERMTQRAISWEAVESTLTKPSFQYWQSGRNAGWQTGYYDPASQIFVGVADGKVATVIDNASQAYVNNVIARVPPP